MSVLVCLPEDIGGGWWDEGQGVAFRDWQSMEGFDDAISMLNIPWVVPLRRSSLGAYRGDVDTWLYRLRLYIRQADNFLEDVSQPPPWRAVSQISDSRARAEYVLYSKIGELQDFSRSLIRQRRCDFVYFDTALRSSRGVIEMRRHA